MVWFGAIAIGLVIGFIDIVLLADNKKASTVITVLVRDTLLSVFSGMVLADKILYINGGLPFKFAKKVSQAEMETVRNWVADIRANLA